VPDDSDRNEKADAKCHVTIDKCTGKAGWCDCNGNNKTDSGEKGWNCTEVTTPHPYLALPCNKVYKQCGGQGFKGNPCCEKGLVCTGKNPKYYMQCKKKWQVEKEQDADDASDADAGDGDLDDDELGLDDDLDEDDVNFDNDDDLGLAALPGSVDHKVPAPSRLVIAAAGLLTLAGASALAASALVLRRRRLRHAREGAHEALRATTDAEDAGLEG